MKGYMLCLNLFFSHFNQHTKFTFCRLLTVNSARTELEFIWDKMTVVTTERFLSELSNILTWDTLYKVYVEPSLNSTK